MDAKILVAIADGSEEIEAVVVIDVLRRAGLAVTVASCAPEGRLQVVASRGVHITADCAMDDLLSDTFDLIVLPGGMPGAEHLRDQPTLAIKLRQQHNHRRWIAAICASPAVVLKPLGFTEGRQLTCYPAFQGQFSPAQLRANDAVVVDEPNMLVTSQGPGTSFSFALTLVELLCGGAKANEVKSGLLLDRF
ncbi:MAG: DJ-1/PfpI family protein [Gammaproteobacteria bacterium]|nr:DJ-1/PfpI family protein [Gammaproteobacteria bacterium]